MMKHNTKIFNNLTWLLLALAFSFTSWQVSATDFYVDAAKGKDSNSGRSETQSLQTISAAVSKMSAGDVCIIAGGVYRETITVSKSGLTFQPLDNKRVIITGTEVITGWKAEPNGIYSKNMNGYKLYDNRVSQVFSNYQQMDVARFPNNTSSDPFDQKILTADSGSQPKDTNNGTIIDEDLRNSGINFTDCKLWYMGWNFDAGRYWVSSIGATIDNALNNYIKFKVPQYNGHNSVFSKCRYFLYGHEKLLDTNKEWHYNQDNKTLLFKPIAGTNPNSTKTEVRIRNFGLVVTGSNNTFRSIYLYAANVQLRGSNNEITNTRIHYPVPFIDMKAGYHRSNFSETSIQNGVLLSGSNNKLVNSEVAYSWSDGVSVLGTGNTVENCLIHDVDWSATEGAGVSMNGSKHKIEKNEIYNLGRSVIVHRGTTNTKIRFNDMYNYGILTTDMGGTYCFETTGGGKGTETEIAYNWLHDTKPNFEYGRNKQSNYEGIYLDNGSKYHVVHHNVVWNVQGAGMRINLSSEHQSAYNNTFWNNTTAMSEWARKKDPYKNDQKVYNNLSDKTAFYGTDVRNNQTLPNNQFVNAAAGDFRLVPGSQAINKGIVIPNITTNVTDGRPDIGAYELGKKWDTEPGSTITKTTLPEWFGGTPPVDPNPPTPNPQPNGDFDVAISAKGLGANEKLQLIDGTTVLASWTITTTSYKTYSTKIKKPVGDSLRLYFDGLSDVQVDYLKVQDTKYEAEEYVNTASWSKNGGCGSIKDEWMYCNGYIQFKDLRFKESKTSSEIIIAANGVVGTEDMTLTINGTIKKTMSNVPVKRSQYKFTVDTPTVLAMRLDFLGLGIQKEDLTVDYISIDGIKYETEAQQENTGSWTAFNGCGGNMGEILHCPGYVQYNVAASIGGKPATEPSSATALFSLYPNPASESVTISGPGMAELRLMDSNGRVIVNRTIENSINLNISDLKTGIYLISILSKEKREVKKLVIQ